MAGDVEEVRVEFNEESRGEMHKVKLTSSKEKTELFLDGIPLHDSCLAFSMHKHGSEIPVVELTLKCNVDIESEADLNMQSEGIQNDLARG